jgi:hypothetical protein
MAKDCVKWLPLGIFEPPIQLNKSYDLIISLEFEKIDICQDAT